MIPSAPGERRLGIVGVMGSGSAAHLERSRAIGAWLAGLGVHLLTGGGGGVMTAVSRAYHEAPRRRGSVIGVLPGLQTRRGIEPPPGYPNPWVEIPILTHLPLSGAQGTDPRSRNHINVLSADAIVALPGSHGTASEVALALRYGRPLIAWLDRREQIDGLPTAARVESDLNEVRRFVTDCLARR